MPLKAICTDIDGTLLDKNRELSPRTRRAFARLPAEVPVILASSRMPSAMIHLLKDLGRENDPLICYNGGYVLPTYSAKQHPIRSVWIPVEICQQIALLTQSTNIHLSLYSGNSWYAPKRDAWTEKEERATKVQATLLENAAVFSSWAKNGCGAHKVMCMGPENEIQTLYEQLQERLSSVLHLYRSKNTYLEIASKPISKATGLQDVLTNLGIKMEEVIAFGDNYNDIELLASVGLGVAVGNAIDEVKAVARETTASNKQDGVAIAIEKYLL